LFYKSSLYVVALFILQPLAACSDENRSANVTTTTPQAAAPAVDVAQAKNAKLIVAFGDSLYAGYGVSPQESFPFELQRALVGRGVAVTVQNAGVSGDTSSAGLRRLAFTLDGSVRKPDLVMVNLGGNDMLRGIDPGETRSNLTAICAELKRRGIPIMLTGMIAAPNLGREYADGFNPIYADLAKRFGATLYPFFLDGVVNNSALMLPDHMHPNGQGIDKIVGNVAPLVVKALADGTSNS
jgi:acyl-CoA thioesterase-1